MRGTCIECGEPDGLRLREGSTTCGRCAYTPDDHNLVMLAYHVRRHNARLELDRLRATLIEGEEDLARSQDTE